MTAIEIKSILEKEMSIKEFASNEFGPNEIFVASDEVKEIKAKYEQAYQDLKSHPLYNKSRSEQSGNHEYMELEKTYRGLPSGFQEETDEWLESIGLGPIKKVYSKGGEGQGEEWCVVYYFPKHNIYMKCEGYYSSYDGTEFNGWDDCFEVKPEEVTITVYEKVN